VLAIPDPTAEIKSIQVDEKREGHKNITLLYHPVPCPKTKTFRLALARIQHMGRASKNNYPEIPIPCRRIIPGDNELPGLSGAPCPALLSPLP
jgi:hypothetical protein